MLGGVKLGLVIPVLVGDAAREMLAQVNRQAVERFAIRPASRFSMLDPASTRTRASALAVRGRRLSDHACCLVMAVSPPKSLPTGAMELPPLNGNLARAT